MKIVYDPRHVFHVPKSQFINSKIESHMDTPQRIEETVKTLKSKYSDCFIKSGDFPRSYLYMAHESDYIYWLKNKCKSLPNGEEYFPEIFGYDRIYDNKTPLMYNSFEIAWISVKNALTGAQQILKNFEDTVYVLTRPAGHHAGFSSSGGYCYLNNAAIATKYIQSKTGGFIAVLDLDFFHGNGTQEIFYSDNSVLFISIHGNPINNYPYNTGYEWEIGDGAGKGYNINFPLEDSIDGRIYLRVLEKSLLEIEDFAPEQLIISFGSNIHREDPNGKFNLSLNDFKEIGRMIGELNVNKLILQEGGTSGKLNADSIDKFLEGLIN